MFFRLYCTRNFGAARFFLFGLLFMLFSSSLSGQRFSTISFGSNFSNILGVNSEIYDLTRGFYLGMGYYTFFSDPFSFGAELKMNSKGFGHSHLNTSPTRDLYYSNNVEQLSLAVPFLLLLHTKKFSFETGPYIEFMVNIRQTEIERTVYKMPQQEVTEIIYTDRQELNKNELGMIFGISYNIFKNIDLSASYVQAFTPPGREYSWQRQRVFQAGLKLNFGRSFSPRKLQYNPGTGRNGSADYRTLSSSNVVRVLYRYMGEGNDVVLRFRTADKMNYNLAEMMIGNSSGELRISDYEYSIRNVDFPFFANMRFSFENSSTGSAINYYLNFEISRRGNWEVIIEY
jgi:hypothetical protein